MGRRNKKDTEEYWHRYEKFKEENQKLRKEVAKLRKLVREMYSDRLQDKLKRQEEGLEPIKPLCETCGNENLSEVPIKRADGEFYIKVCNHCGTRSDMKKKKDKQ